MNVRFVGGVISVALLAGGLFLADRFYSVPAPPVDMSPAAVDAELQAQGIDLFRIVKAGFPQEYAALTQELSAALQQGAGQSDLALISQQAMIRLRQTHSDALLAGPDEHMRKVITMSRDVHGAVREEEGREACNNFAIGGPPALGTSLVNYIEALDAQGSVVMEAIAKGRASKAEPVLPVAAEEWDAARERALADGASPAHLDALKELDQENGDLCAGLISLMDAMLAMDDSLGQRLRASYVRDLARN